MTNSSKSTDISKIKLLDSIQEEYLICLLRAQVYPLEPDKIYWTKLSNLKKDKIENLCKFNNFKSIFDDDFLLNKVKLKSFNEFGYPNFYYPNEANRSVQEQWDFRNYFSVGSEVQFVDEDDDFKIKKGVINSRNIESKLIEIVNSENTSNFEIEIDHKLVKRIFENVYLK